MSHVPPVRVPSLRFGAPPLGYSFPLFVAPFQFQFLFGSRCLPREPTCRRHRGDGIALSISVRRLGRLPLPTALRSGRAGALRRHRCLQPRRRELRLPRRFLLRRRFRRQGLCQGRRRPFLRFKRRHTLYGYSKGTRSRPILSRIDVTVRLYIAPLGRVLLGFGCGPTPVGADPPLCYGNHLKDVLHVVHFQSGVRRHRDRFWKFDVFINMPTFYFVFKGGGSKP